MYAVSFLSPSKQAISAVAALIFLSGLVSCVSGGQAQSDGETARHEAAPASEPQEIRLGEELLGAIRSGDYGALSRTLAGKTAFDISRKDFDASCAGVLEKYGRPETWTHLTALSDPVAPQDVWKVRFVRKRADGPPVERDMLFRLACAKVDGKLSVMAFGFF